MFVAGSQVGKTELILNLLGWCLTDNPRPCMYVGPTQDQVRDIASDRFDKMIRQTEALHSALDPRSTHQRVFERWVNGAKASFAWAGSASQLASKPAALVLIDERDRMSNDVGGEGDPVEVVAARTKSYFNAKVGIFSTPTLVGVSPIWKWFELGTRQRWALQCPHCRAYFVPRLEFLRWPKGAEGEELRELARLACPACGVELDDDARRRLPGKFVAHGITDHGEERPLEETPRQSVVSFQVSGLASPLNTLGQMAETLAGAYRSGEQGRVQGVVNTWFGECYEIVGDRPQWEQVWAKRERYDQVDEIQMVTIGVDVQDESLYYVVRGWGWMVESWLLDFGQLHGFTRQRQVWADLTDVREATYNGLPVEVTFIDAGHLTDKVDAYVRANERVESAMGRDRQDPELERRFIKKKGMHRWFFSSDWWKTWLYDRVRLAPGEPGGWQVLERVTRDYCEQVVNEELILRSSGVRQWRPTGNRQNHYLDAEILATCAAYAANVRKLRRLVSSPGAHQDGLPKQPTSPQVVEPSRAPGFFSRPLL